MKQCSHERLSSVQGVTRRLSSAGNHCLKRAKRASDGVRHRNAYLNQLPFHNIYIIIYNNQSYMYVLLVGALLKLPDLVPLQQRRFPLHFSKDFRGGHICDDTFGRAPGGGASSDRGPRAPTVLSFRRMKQFCWFMNPCQIMCERHQLHKHPAGPETVPIKRTFF